MDKYVSETVKFIDEKGESNWKDFERISKMYDDPEEELAKATRRFAQIAQFRMREENKKLDEIAEETLIESGIKKLPLGYQEITKFLLGNFWYYAQDFRMWLKSAYGQDLDEFD